MDKTDIKKRTQLLIILLVSVIAVQSIVLGSIANSKKESKVFNAVMYGQTVSDSIKLTLENSLEASESLKYFYTNYGESCFDDFDKIAADIAKDHPVIGSLYIAPKAVIKVAYPKEVNESTIGFAMLEDPEQGPRAQLAKDTRKVTVAGPHDLVEGGVGFIIRNPVYSEDEFVGFTIIVLDWDKFVDKVLENVAVVSDKYKIAVWKNDYDEHAVADEDGYIFRNSTEPISKKIDIEFSVPNDVWHLVVEPVEGWGVISDLKWYIVSSLLIGFGIIGFCIVLYLNEEKKKQLKKEQLQNESKSNFLNNMSHDIRTPMNAILGFTGLMKKKLDDPEVVKDYLGKIEESGEYLLSIINNVLDMARIDSGKMELDLDGMDVGSDRKRIISLFDEEIKKKNINFSHDLTVQHKHVLADEARMTQIMVNLLSNAVKYTPEGGAIRLITREIPCDISGYATYVTTVSDTGIGMSKEFQSHIFDSFSRERTTTESKVIGTGLGMSIVKKLVDLMGGTIEVESELGHGSTFKVTLTLKIMETPEDYYNSQLSENGDDDSLTGRRILLAEDNDLNAEIAITVLEEIGLIIERAADGVECINMLVKAESGYYDLILMDIQMPNLNGYETTDKIRKLEDKNKANIPIVAMTANAFEEDKKHALDCGMNGHLAKPINIGEMLKEMNRVLAK